MQADSTQLSKDLNELRYSWYSIAKLCDGLSRYGSAREEGFGRSLDAVLSGLESFEKLLDDFYQTIISGFTVYREVESQKNEIFERTADLKKKLNTDRNKITSLEGTDEKTINTKLDKLQQLYKDIERQTAEKCNKYLERKNEYTVDRGKIEREVGRKIEAIGDAFTEKIFEITDGYEITLGGYNISEDGLFEALVDGRADIEGIDIKALDGGGFFDAMTGSASKHEKAKASVLKYEAQETARKARPFKKREMELIAGLDRKFSDLQGLEDECKEVEGKRKQILDIRSRLRAELEGLDTPQKLKAVYLKKLDEATPKVESFISLVRIIIRQKTGHIEAEGDFLKEIAVSEKKLDSLRAKVDEGMSKEELIECKKRLDDLKLQIMRLETEIERRIS